MPGLKWLLLNPLLSFLDQNRLIKRVRIPLQKSSFTNISISFFDIVSVISR